MSIRYGKGDIVEGTGNASYEIDSLLSVGMFAVSYLAHKTDGKKVFLKQYKSPSCRVKWYRGYINWQQELKRRIQASPELSERTYGFLDFFESDRAFIQVFAFLEGGKDLRTYLDEEQISSEERFAFASLFLYSLSLFHEAGIIHTDLKPENVFLSPVDSRIGWCLKLIDFDFTVLEGRTAPWHGEMNYCGTPCYMSPEHLCGAVPGRHSDVFTAAIIVYELLAGGHPFPRDDTKYASFVRQGIRPHPVFPPRKCSVFNGCSDAMQKLDFALFTALSPNPKDRPSIKYLHSTLLSAKNDFLAADYKNWTKPKYYNDDQEKSDGSSLQKKTTSRRTVPDEEYAETWRCNSCGHSGIAHTVKKCPACGLLRFSEVVLSGTAGLIRIRIPTILGASNLIGVVGSDDARFANTEQFKVFRESESGQWYIVAARPDIANPPLLNNSVIDTIRRQISNGDTIFVASSRKATSIRKGKINVSIP